MQISVTIEGQEGLTWAHWKRFVAEVERLLKDHGTEAPAFKAIGYREVGRYLLGEISRDEAQALTVKATTKYAKRQMTWFRKDKRIHWFEVKDLSDLDQIAEKIISSLN